MYGAVAGFLAGAIVGAIFGALGRLDLAKIGGGIAGYIAGLVLTALALKQALQVHLQRLTAKPPTNV